MFQICPLMSQWSVKEFYEKARVSSDESYEELDCNICKDFFDDCLSQGYRIGQAYHQTLNCLGCGKLVHKSFFNNHGCKSSFFKNTV